MVGGVAVVHTNERMHYVSFPEYCVLLDLKEILINEIRLRDRVLCDYVHLLDHVPHMRPVRCHGPPLYRRKRTCREFQTEKVASVGGRDVSVGDMSLRWGDRRLLILLGRRRFIYFVNNSATAFIKVVSFATLPQLYRESLFATANRNVSYILAATAALPQLIEISLPAAAFSSVRTRLRTNIFFSAPGGGRFLLKILSPVACSWRIWYGFLGWDSVLLLVYL